MTGLPAKPENAAAPASAVTGGNVGMTGGTGKLPPGAGINWGKAMGSAALRIWRRGTGGSVNRRIFGAALTVGVLTVLVKIVSVAKELTVARSFGAADAVDAFFIAFILPSFSINVVAGAFNTALIPAFVQVRDREGREAAQSLLSSVIAWSFLLLVAVCLLFVLSANYVLPILGSGFVPAKISLTHSLFLLLVPCIISTGIGTTWAAVLNAGQRFALPAVLPAITPLVTMLLIVTCSNSWGVYSLALGMLLGSLAELALLAKGLKQEGYSLRPHWRSGGPALRRVINQYIPMAAGAFLMSSTNLVDQSMAASLGPGSVAALNYGNRIVGFILSVASLAIGTAVFPHFSEMVARQNWEGLRHTLRVYSKLILFGALPVCLGLALFSEPLVRMVFERGRFTSENSFLAAQVQSFYALQMPFYALGILFVRLISALGGNQFLMWGAVISLPLDVLCNLLFIHQIGIAGIGLSTTVVYLVSCIYLRFVLEHRLNKFSRASG